MAHYYFDAWGLKRTDHAPEIREMQERADSLPPGIGRVSARLAAELLQSHDETGISLDDWPTARRFVEHYCGSPILPNLI